jgi:hypothetical protein
MAMAALAHLDKQDAVAEVVHHPLVALRIPPFNCEIGLSPATIIQNGVGSPVISSIWEYHDFSSGEICRS